MIKRVIDIDDNGVVIRTRDFDYKVFDNKKGYLLRHNSYNFKSFKNEPKLSSVVKKHSDIGKLHILAENTFADTNLICGIKNRKHSPASIELISKMIDLGEDRCKRFITKMVKAGVIARAYIEKDNTIEVQYYLSPLYFLSSKYLSPSLYMLFQKELDLFLPEWVVKRFNDTIDLIE